MAILAYRTSIGTSCRLGCCNQTQVAQTIITVNCTESDSRRLTLGSSHKGKLAAVNSGTHLTLERLIIGDLLVDVVRQRLKRGVVTFLDCNSMRAATVYTQGELGVGS